MLQSLVGNVDMNSALVLIACAICLCIIATSLIVKRRSPFVLRQEFDLAKTRLRNEDEANKRSTDLKREYELAKLASERDTEFKRIDSNLITSHARVVNE